MNSFHDSLDLRVRRTDKFLWDALFALMSERSFEAITVTDICERAMVHRTTFYKHYEDKYKLLEQGVQTELRALFAAVDEAVEKPGGKEAPMHTRTWLIAVFAHVLTQKSFYRLMLTGDGFCTFNTLLRKGLAAHLERHLHHEGKQLTLPMALYAQLHAASLVGMLAWWLEHDCYYPPAEMIQHISTHLDLI